MRKITIENLLTWAFVEELPKVGAGNGGTGVTMSSWDAFSDMIVLGTMVDRTPNTYGVVPGFIYTGEPHADAVRIGAAVRALAERDGFEVGEGWNPFPDWTDQHGLVRSEVARVVAYETSRAGRMNGRHVANLVTTCAVLKRGPDWSAAEPTPVMLMNKGKPAWFVKRWHRDRTGNRVLFEDNGFDQKKQRPFPGAYRKFRLAEPIHGAIMARLDWQLWQSAMEALADSLQTGLSDHQITPFHPNRQPWTTQKKAAPKGQAIENAAE